MRVVVALGADRWPQPDRAAAIHSAAAALASVARQHDLVVTLGCGPQPERLAAQGQVHADPASQTPGPPASDDTDATPELQQALAQLLGPARTVEAVSPRVGIDRADPAFGHPDHAVGPRYTQEQAQRLAASHQWSTAPAGTGYRRVVASARPQVVIGLADVAALLARGATVLVSGNGGIPLATPSDRLPDRDLDAVVDPDLFSALLAHALGADCLLLVGDGDTRRAAQRYLHDGGKRAAVGSLDQLAALVDGSGGTQYGAAADSPH